MSFISIDTEKCIKCGQCSKDCPAGIIQQKKGQQPYIEPSDTKNCILCGHCVAICQKSAFHHSLLVQENFKSVPDSKIDSKSFGNFLCARRSVRIFKQKSVPEEQIKELIEVSRRAPTAANSQKVSWSIITQANRLEKIRMLTLNFLIEQRPDSIYSKMAKQGKDSILRGGPNLIVAYSPENYGWAQCDCAIALTYMELYAASMNLGACWAGLVTTASRYLPELRNVLGVPEENIVGGALILGIPVEKYYQIPPRNKANVNWL